MLFFRKNEKHDMSLNHAYGHHMATEISQAREVFVKRLTSDIALDPLPQAWNRVYTIARGSSDAVATILSYEWMRVLNLPMTSLPPSIFSLGSGIQMDEALCLVISQSGSSHDLVSSTKGAVERGAHVLALTNQEASPVEEHAHQTLPILAGPEVAVPATKTVIASIAAGLAILGQLAPEYRDTFYPAIQAFERLKERLHPRFDKTYKVLKEAEHVYVIGRGAGYGAAQEVALKLKECCSLHAEAYSASEVLHGPLQLAKKPLSVLILDTGEVCAEQSLEHVEQRLRAAKVNVVRMTPSLADLSSLSPAAAAAVLLYLMYPIIRRLSLDAHLNPDRPDLLSKVTFTK